MRSLLYTAFLASLLLGLMIILATVEPPSRPQEEQEVDQLPGWVFLRHC